jgi:ABC-type polysaccharide/polyol phosphate transport system ATPase subunit
MPIIEVKHLTKEYDLGTMTSLKDNIRHTLAKLQGKGTWQRERFKALDDVNFSIDEGEVVGIIGHNGAGKSTLLKHLANITKPTRGEVIVRGSIAPLIEVGAGVNPELTGRENIFLNGAILGIPKKIIQSKLDEIIDFSELEQFIDTPVKRYSSGMTVKLGFSIATSLDADILIIDEVLAVGDLAFQRKCFDRMEHMIRREGKTVILVSHNIRQVERLCTRTILLSQGKIALDDTPKTACNAFYKASDEEISRKRTINREARIKSDDTIEIKSIRMTNARDEELSSLQYGEEVQFEIIYNIKQNVSKPIFGLGIHTTDFLYLATSQSIGELETGDLTPGLYTLRYKIEQFPFLPGNYSLRLGVALGDTFHPIFYAENIHPIQVGNTDINRATASTGNEGFISLNGDWSIEKSAMNCL